MDILIDPYRFTPAIPACFELVQITTQAGVGSGAAATARATFLSGLASYVSANMDHLPAYPTTPEIKPSATVSIWGGLGTISTDNNFSPAYIADTASGASYPGRFNTTSAGSGNWLDSENSLIFTLSASRNAFCCYITDLGDFAGNIEFVFSLGATVVKTLAVPYENLDTNEIMHVGYSDGAVLFDKIRIQINQNEVFDPFDSIGFDDLVVGLTVTCTPA